MVGTEPPPHVLRVPRWTLIVHIAQIVLAIVILGLDAYGIRWIAYNALIYSLVTCLFTMGACIYLVGSQLFLHQFYNMYIVLGVHVWMIIFWIVDLGLVANLAKIWSGPRCTYGYSGYYYTYYCSYKRDLNTLTSRDEGTTYSAYYGALAAGAVFAAMQFVLWVFSAIILVIHLNKHRSAAATNTAAQPQVPPQYPQNNGQAVPLEKYNQAGAQAPVQQTPQPQYVQPVPPAVHHTPQQQYMQPGQPVQHMQPNQQHYPAPYPQEPIPRQDTVSPVSQAGYGYGPPSNASEYVSPQHTGQSYPPNVSELSSPQHTGKPNPDVPELSSHK